MRSRPVRLFALGASLLAALALLGASARVPADPIAGASPAASLRVHDAWIRWLPGDRPLAGYMTLSNEGPATVMLVGARSADYAEVSIHQTHRDAGMSMMMMPVSSLKLTPHAELRFAEGGYHLMLQHPKRSVKPGDEVAITLNFASGETLDARFQVRGTP